MDPLFRRARRIVLGKLQRVKGTPPPPPEDDFEPASSAAPDRLSEARRILEVHADADAEEIREAYRRLCRRYHPDRFGNEPRKLALANELMARINAAYERLGGR